MKEFMVINIHIDINYDDDDKYDKGMWFFFFSVTTV